MARLRVELGAGGLLGIHGTRICMRGSTRYICPNATIGHFCAAPCDGHVLMTLVNSAGAMLSVEAVEVPLTGKAAPRSSSAIMSDRSSATFTRRQLLRIYLEIF